LLHPNESSIRRGPRAGFVIGVARTRRGTRGTKCGGLLRMQRIISKISAPVKCYFPGLDNILLPIEV